MTDLRIREPAADEHRMLHTPTRDVQLVISRGDSVVDLQVTDHALDAVALAIHAPVPADFGLAIGFGRIA